jgi:predicted kinase
VDRVSDLAFLVMDLQASGHGEHVAPLLAGYGQPVEPVVLQLFCAYRAHVRAKVEAATSAEADIPAAQRRAAEPAARNHLSLALAYACLGVRPPALVLLHGVSGSGKSHLAARLAPWLLADHHRSDRIRKRLHGLDPLDRPSPVERQHLYGPAADRRTEVALLAAAEASLRRGCWVLLDATHLRAASRKRALALAQSLGACPLLLDVRAPEGLVRERLRRRVAGNDDPSDADLTVRLAQDRYAQALSAEERLRTVPVESSETMDSSMVLMGLWDQWARLPEAIQGIQPSASP